MLGCLRVSPSYASYTFAGIHTEFHAYTFAPRLKCVKWIPTTFTVAYRLKPAVCPFTLCRQCTRRFTRALSFRLTILLATISLSLCGEPFTDSYHTSYSFFFYFYIVPSLFSLHSLSYSLPQSLALPCEFSRVYISWEKKQHSETCIHKINSEVRVFIRGV